MSDTPATEHADDTASTGASAPAEGAAQGSHETTQHVAPGPTNANADIGQMGYEQARDELASIVSTLEGGRAPLEESMRLWERGEALADHCTRWLDGAQTRIEEAVARRDGGRQGTATD